MHFDMADSKSSNQKQYKPNIYQSVPQGKLSARDKQFGTCAASRSHHLCETS